MKKRNITRYIFAWAVYFGLASTAALTSCNDWLTAHPEDDIVDDDYWHNGDQVQSVVTSCYRWLADASCLERMIVWGELRSDNVEAGSAASSEERNIMDVNVLSSNGLASWDCFYKVINICNNVIKKAPHAMETDANYREDEMQANVAEALTIRALCYFYLVRAFGDVPYVTEPSASESTDYNLPQSSADEIVIPALIADLERAIPMARSAWSTTEETKGRITRNAVRALLADIYLWAGRYSECIATCDAILNDPTSNLKLVEGEKYINKVFYEGVSDESIFELVYETNALTSTTIQSKYGNPSQNLSAHAVATMLFYNEGFTYNPEMTDTIADLRGIGSMTYSTGTHPIFKYTGQTPGTFSNYHSSSSYTWRNASSQANWIVYRLSDVYLMKAEALANIATTQAQVDEVAALCNLTYRRATMGQDTLSHDLFGVGQASRNQVLQERRREFCFEGKRWFDLLRRIRQDGNPDYSLQLMGNRYSSDKDASLKTTKLRHLGAWYMPVYSNQMSINKNLHQNDYYQAQEK